MGYMRLVCHRMEVHDLPRRGGVGGCKLRFPGSSREPSVMSTASETSIGSSTSVLRLTSTPLRMVCFGCRGEWLSPMNEKWTLPSPYACLRLPVVATERSTTSKHSPTSTALKLSPTIARCNRRSSPWRFATEGVVFLKEISALPLQPYRPPPGRLHLTSHRGKTDRDGYTCRSKKTTVGESKTPPSRQSFSDAPR